MCSPFLLAKHKIDEQAALSKVGAHCLHPHEFQSTSFNQGIAPD